LIRLEAACAVLSALDDTVLTYKLSVDLVIALAEIAMVSYKKYVKSKPLKCTHFLKKNSFCWLEKMENATAINIFFKLRTLELDRDPTTRLINSSSLLRRYWDR